MDELTDWLWRRYLPRHGLNLRQLLLVAASAGERSHKQIARHRTDS